MYAFNILIQLKIYISFSSNVCVVLKNKNIYGNMPHV